MNANAIKYMLLRPFGDGDYGFAALGDMPAGEYVSADISALCTAWAVTGDFSAVAENHCAAVAVMNLALYFAAGGRPELKKPSYGDTFAAVHKAVGNGPVFRLTGRAKRYFANCGYVLASRPLGDYGGIRAAVNNGHPCVLLLADGLLQWHWVLAVGCREYAGGGEYIRLVSGWHRAADRFYMPGCGSVVLYAAELWVQGH